MVNQHTLNDWHILHEHLYLLPATPLTLMYIQYCIFLDQSYIPSIAESMPKQTMHYTIAGTASQMQVLQSLRREFMPVPNEVHQDSMANTYKDETVKVVRTLSRFATADFFGRVLRSREPSFNQQNSQFYFAKSEHGYC